MTLTGSIIMRPRGLSSISYEAPPGVGGGASGGRAERLSRALREAESLGLSIGTVDRAVHSSTSPLGAVHPRRSPTPAGPGLAPWALTGERPVGPIPLEAPAPPPRG